MVQIHSPRPFIPYTSNAYDGRVLGRIQSRVHLNSIAANHPKFNPCHCFPPILRNGV